MCVLILNFRKELIKIKMPGAVFTTKINGETSVNLDLWLPPVINFKKEEPKQNQLSILPVAKVALIEKENSLNLFCLSHCLITYWAVQWSWFAWMNAVCNLLRKMSREVAVSLPGWFLSRSYFTLCITMEVEPRIVKQYKCHHCCSCKNYGGKGM